MDDAKLASEMTLDGIARQLEAIRSDVTGLKSDMTGIKGDMTGIKADMTGIKADMTGIKADMTGIKADMTGIKADMTGMKTDMTGMKTDMTGMKAEIAGLKTEVNSGFRKVGDELNAAKIRDEELRGLTKFGLEAREALRQSVNARFDETDKKHNEEISLLKDVLRHVQAPQKRSLR